ncbi:MAG: carbon-nitrogen hydrolase family protein [Anaerolineae bacterium]|nr:carbon-nitrogen hydrolase family protein [Anaerolineae bacterium]
MRELTVAVAQMKPVLGQPEENIVKMSEMIRTIATKQRVDLIVFPELITSGAELGLRFTEVAQRVPGATVNLIAKRANEYGVYVLFGMATKEKVESILYNSAVLVGPEGEFVDLYHKVHLSGEERMAFREGFKLPVVETEIGSLGILIGYDLAFPEVARSLTLEGAEVLCVLANWEASGLDAWRTFIRARALENALYVAGANRIGEDVTLTFGGESMIVGPRGEIHASLAGTSDKDSGEPQEGAAIATLDLDAVREVREENQYIQNRQPAVYRAIVRKY